jgi:ATP-dependent RNA helicase RhlE
VTPTATTVERIEQSVTMINQAEKPALLAIVLKRDAVERALVFSRTKHGADKIVRQLEAAGIPAGAIHGNKSQAQRERAIAAFKSGDMRVLIATDIAARGIDIPGVSHVVNFDLPDVPEQYVHRIGRTARAGADGIAIAFCSPDERGNLRDIERTTRQRIAVAPLPADFTAQAEALKRLKPAPRAAASQRADRSSTKADRRHDGQQRRNRNDGQRRHSQRSQGHPAHRSSAQDRNGQRRDDERHEGARSSYRPETYREAQPERRPDDTQRQPKRKFRGRRRRPGGGERVHG